MIKFASVLVTMYGMLAIVRHLYEKFGLQMLASNDPPLPEYRPSSAEIRMKTMFPTGQNRRKTAGAPLDIISLVD